MNPVNSDPEAAAVVKTKNAICSEKIVDVNNKKVRVRVSPKGSFCPSSSLSGPLSLFRRHAELLMQNHGNFKRSDQPGRVMYYNDEGSWVDYPEAVAELLKSSFAEGRSVSEVKINGSTCLIDFYRMLEFELDTGIEKSIAWIDVNGNCFFPQVFLNSTRTLANRDEKNENEASLPIEFPKIEVEVRICDSNASGHLDVSEANLCKRRRENEELEVEPVVRGKSEGSSTNFPAKRQQVPADEMRTPRWPNTKVISEEEKTFMIMKGFFLTGCGTLGLGIAEPGATITRIHQCTRRESVLRARYNVFMKQIEIVKRTRGDANVVFAWYGTSAEGLESILTRGFGLSNQMQGPKAYGQGVHLSSIKFPYNSALLAEKDHNGEKHVVLCRVVLGNCEKVELGSQQAFPSGVNFDTGVDNLENPEWYVVWRNNMNTHIMPEVIVSYKPAENVIGQLAGTPSVKSSASSNPSVADFIARLRSSIPPSKVQELQTLYGLFKDGKMGKENFTKELRSLVGDAMLRSILRGVHGRE